MGSLDNEETEKPAATLSFDDDERRGLAIDSSVNTLVS